MKTLPRLLSLSALVLALAAPALAQEHDHAAHEKHGAAPAKPAQPAAGKKWATDAPLRKSMAAIRALVQTNLPAVHAGKLGDAAYAALGKQIDGEIAAIFQACKLAPDADAALHEILLPMMEGSQALQAGGARQAGFVKILTHVNAYGERFDHPGFEPVRH
jgi:hypothetical protein